MIWVLLAQKLINRLKKSLNKLFLEAQMNDQEF